MAGIFAHVEDDINNLRRLKKEIEAVKEALKSINIKVDIDIKQGLEDQLKSLTSQYSNLANKVIEVEQRIASAQNTMKKSTANIIKNNDNGGSVDVKSYEDLKGVIDEVVGARDINLAKIIEEQQAIEQLKSEINAIHKVRKEEGTITEEQKQRLIQLNGSLIQHQQSLSATKKALTNEIKMEQVAKGSMEDLSLSLGRMRKAYREMGEEERDSAEGKELLEKIQETDKKIKELDASIGNFQRNVGNYPQGMGVGIVSFNQLSGEAERLTEKLSSMTDAEKNSAEGQELQEHLADIQGQMEETKPTVDDLKDAIIAFGGITIAQDLIRSIAATRSEFQKLEISFNTMLGSKEKSDALMAQLTKTAAVTPFGLQDVASGAKQLLAYGMEAEKVNDTLIRLGDIASGLSIPLGDLVYLYGTTMTQGRLFTQDLRQFMGRGIPITEELAKQFGVTKDEVGELVTAGRVGFPEVEKAIMSLTDEGSQFGGLMEAQSKTIEGQISNVQDSIDGMFNSLGKSSEGIINTALGSVSWVVEHWEELGKVLMTLVATYGIYKTAVIASSAIDIARIKALRLVALGHNATTAAVIRQTIATKAATMAQGALNTVMSINPYVALATAILGVGTALWAFSDNSNSAEKAEEDLNKRLEETNELFGERKQKMQDLVSVATDEMRMDQERQEALESLKDIMPDIFNQYITFVELTNKKTEAQEAFNEALRNERKVISDKQYSDDFIRLQNLQRMLEIVEEARLKYNESGSLFAKKLTESQEFAALSNQAFGSIVLSGATIKDEIKKMSAQVNIQMNDMRKTAQADFLASVSKMEDSEITNHASLIQKYLEQLNNEGKKYIYLSGENFSTSYVDLQARLMALQQERVNRAAYKSSDPKNELLKELADAKAKLKDAMSKPTQYINETAYQAAVDSLNATIKDIEDKLKKYFNYSSSDSKASITKQDNRLQKIEEEQANKRKKSRYKTANELEQLEIDLMQEGTAKKMRQLNLDFAKELQAIEAWEDEIKAAKIAEARAVFEANPANKDKLFDSSTVDTSLSDDESKLKTQKQINVLMAFLNKRYEINKEASDKEANALAEYIRNYGTYLQRKELLEKEHLQRLAELRKSGAGKNQINLENANYNASVQSLDEQFGKTPQSMADLFEDASRKSVREIQKIIDKYKSLLHLLSSGGATPEALKNLGFSDSEIQKIRTGQVNLKDLGDAIKTLEEGVANRSPFNAFIQGLEDSFALMKKTEKQAGKVGLGIMGIGESITAFMPALSEFSSNIASIFGFDDGAIQDALGAVGGVGQAASGIGQMMSGDIVGGLMSAASGIASVVSSIKSLADRDNETRIKKLQGKVEELQDSYEKASKEVDSSYSYDKAEAIQAQNENLEKQQAQIQQMIAEEEAKKDTDNERIKEWKKQLEDINALIEENKQAMLDAVMGEDLASAIDRFASSYADAVASGTSKWEGAKNFVKDSIKKMTMEAIKGALQSSEAIANIRAKLDEFFKDGIITIAEENQLNEMAEKAMAELDAKFGWANRFMDDDTTEQEAASRGISSLTQEQGEELNGRFTALQIAGEAIRTQSEEQTQQMALLVTTSAELKAMSEKSFNALEGVNDQIAQMYLEVQEINANTSASASYLKVIKDDIAAVKKNTENLV